MPNYFGEQRFSRYNADIGKCIVKGDFKKAIDLILKSNSDYKERIQEYLEKNKNNFTAALGIIPLRLRKLYIHAYQSDLWNKTLEEFQKDSNKVMDIPIIGFATELKDDPLKKIITELMKQEDLSFRDFIIKKAPELSSEGTLRKSLVEIKNLKVLDKSEEKIKISFALDKGTYATSAIRYLLS
jgi:tRNA pseudouridine13 synthase